MNRLTRMVCVAATAAAAIALLVATPAWAVEGITTETGEYPATLTGTPTTAIVISNGVREISCSSISWTGSLAGVSEEAHFAQSTSGCTGNAGTTAKMEFGEGRITLVRTGFLKWHLTESIADWIVKIWAMGKSEPEPPLCELKITEAGNQDITGVTSTNEGSGIAAHIKLAIASSNLNIKRTSGTAVNCGVVEKTTGTWTGTMSLTATHAGKEVGLMSN